MFTKIPSKFHVFAKVGPNVYRVKEMSREEVEDMEKDHFLTMHRFLDERGFSENINRPLREILSPTEYVSLA